MLPYLPPDPNQVTIVEPGIPVRVVRAVTVEQVLSPTVYRFGFSPAQARAPLLVDYSCTGAFTVCTAFLQQSFDGGLTFQDIGAVVDLFVNPRGNLNSFFTVAVLVSSPIYRFRIVTLTATTFYLDVAVS
jgi:hypothetical protein